MQDSSKQAGDAADVVPANLVELIVEFIELVVNTVILPFISPLFI